MTKHIKNEASTIQDRARRHLILLHIPKTAGTSLRHVVMRRYAPPEVLILDGLHPERDLDKLIAQTPEQQQERKFISGHIPWGISTKLSMDPAYITCLRDPIERMISLYYYSKRTTDHYLHRTIMQSSLSLDDFLQSSLSTELMNGQTRLLAGLNPISPEPCTEEIYQTALHHLEKDILLAGLSSHFDETLLILTRKMGWTTPPFYRALNVRKTKAGTENISEETRKIFLKNNTFEQDLYQQVRARYEREKAAAGPEFPAKVLKFKKMNTLLQPLIRLKWALIPAKRWYEDQI